MVQASPVSMKSPPPTRDVGIIVSLHRRKTSAVNAVCTTLAPDTLSASIHARKNSAEANSLILDDLEQCGKQLVEFMSPVSASISSQLLGSRFDIGAAPTQTADILPAASTPTIGLAQGAPSPPLNFQDRGKLQSHPQPLPNPRSQVRNSGEGAHGDVVSTAVSNPAPKRSVRNHQAVQQNTAMQREDAWQRPIRVFCMLPLDTVNAEGVFRYAAAPWFLQALQLLSQSGVHGVAVDVWWGAVERDPKHYNWTGYKQLFELLKQLNLRIQAVLSFHACGGNVGDTAQVPLPGWVLQCGEADPDLFYTDRPRENGLGQRNREYLSVWADEDPGVLAGRSPMQCYEDFMTSFRDTFYQDLGGAIEEVVIGAGPCGELRFPSYVEANGWRFPGIGEFQCYDRRARASLAQAAQEYGRPEWGYSGPHDAGNYNSTPEETAFFSHEGGWDTEYGRFFLSWYSNSLLRHGERLLAAAHGTFASKLRPRLHHPCSSSSQVEPGAESNSESSSVLKALLQGCESPQGTSSIPSTTSFSNLQSIGNSSMRTCSAQLDSSSIPCTESTDMDVEQSDLSLSSALADVLSTVPENQQVCGPMQQQTAQPFPRYLPGYTPSSESQEPNLPQSLRPELCNSTSSMSASAAFPDTTPLAVSNDRDDMSDINISTYNTEDGEYVLEYLRRNVSEGCYDDDIIAAQRRQSSELPTPASLPLSTISVDSAGRSSAYLTMTLKIAGIHWWYRTQSHAAELTAGYYNTCNRDGYAAIVELCHRYNASLTLTCVEMCDAQHPAEAQCGPEGLLKQIRTVAMQQGVPLSGENALPIFLIDGVDTVALDRIVCNTRASVGCPAGCFVDSQSQSSVMCLREQLTELGFAGTQVPRCMLQASGASKFGAQQQTSWPWPNLPSPKPPLAGDLLSPGFEQLPGMRSFTFLRLGPELLQASYQMPWTSFMVKMMAGGYGSLS